MSSKRPHVGDILEYAAFGGEVRRIRVEAVEDDIKNGRPGFDGRLVRPTRGMYAGETVWGYDDQITTIIPARSGQAGLQSRTRGAHTAQEDRTRRAPFDDCERCWELGHECDGHE